MPTTFPRLVACALACTAAMPAGAAVLTFDAYARTQNTGVNSINGPIIEDGFIVSSSQCEAPSGGATVGRCFTTQARVNPTNPDSIDGSTTSAAIKTSLAGRTVIIAQLTGEAFTFEGLDLRSNQGSNALNIDFNYTLAAGGTGTRRFSIPVISAAPRGLNYTLDGIGPITSLSLDPVEANGAFHFDNIQVTPFVAAAIPEPASWAMMVAGFGLAGAAVRRRPAARAA